MKPIEIFRAGTHTASSGREVTITKADLAACAKAYDVQLRQAPHVIGHPQTDDPAFGWVGALRVEGDTLVTDGEGLQPEFAQLVKKGSYKQRSAAFYSPTDKGNPVPGTWYLRHVGWLGARQPAVAGLAPIEFAAGEEFVEFADWNAIAVVKLFRNMRDYLIGEKGQAKADEILPSDTIDNLLIDAAQPATECADDLPPALFSQPGAKMTTQQQLDADRASLAVERTEFAQQQRTHRLAGITDFVTGLITAGKLATGHKEPMIAFMATLPTGDDATFEFAQADGTKTSADAMTWFKAFLTTAPNLVPLGEAAQHKPGEEFSQPGKQAGLDPSKVYAIHNQRG